MTNLMLSTIGVLLAAAAVLMVTFYGGEAFFIGSQKAEASRLTVEGAQIEQAVTNFTIRYGRAPGNGGTHDEAMSELMSKKFLASAPRGGGEPGVIDYGTGLIRSDIGASDDEEAREICADARGQQNLPNPERVYRCDGSDHPSGALPANEPCCLF